MNIPSIESLLAELDKYKRAYESCDAQILSLKEQRNRLTAERDEWEANSNQWEQEYYKKDIEVAKLTAERDKADCRAGAAERGYKSYLDAAVARDSWLRKAKSQWGVDSGVSFDVVGAEALAQKEQITKLTDERDAAIKSVNYLKDEVYRISDERAVAVAERDAALLSEEQRCVAVQGLVEHVSTLKSALREAKESLDFYLAANDPSEFGCACDLSVGHLCGPCHTDKQQYPLRKSIAAINAVLKDE